MACDVVSSSSVAVVRGCVGAQTHVHGNARLDVVCGSSGQTTVVDVSNALKMEFRQDAQRLECMEGFCVVGVC